jgi:hypothetical protein
MTTDPTTELRALMDADAATSPRPARLGDYVRTARFGLIGRVTAVHPWGCPQEEKSWRDEQILLRDGDFDGPWVSILVHPAGAVIVPEWDAIVVTPFPYANPHAARYFPPEDPR